MVYQRSDHIAQYAPYFDVNFHAYFKLVQVKLGLDVLHKVRTSLQGLEIRKTSKLGALWALWSNPPGPKVILRIMVCE